MGSSPLRDKEDILDMAVSWTGRKLGSWGNNSLPNEPFCSSLARVLILSGQPG